MDISRLMALYKCSYYYYIIIISIQSRKYKPFTAVVMLTMARISLEIKDNSGALWRVAYDQQPLKSVT